MKLKSRVTVSSNQTTIGVLVGIVSAVVISMLLLLGMTSLMISGKLGDGTINIVVFILRIVAVLIGVLIGMGLSKEKHLMTTGLIVVGYMFLLIGSCIVIYDGTFSGLYLGVISTAIGGSLGLLIRLKLQNGPKRTKKIKR